MLRRLIEKVITLLEQLAQALIDLLRVESDEVKSQVVRWLLVAVTTMVVAVLLAVVFMLSLLLVGMEEIGSKLQSIGHYFVVVSSALVALASSVFGLLKLWRKFFPAKERQPSRESLHDRSYRLATGDEETDPKVLRHAIMNLLESLGEEVVTASRRGWTLFVCGSQEFARLRDTVDGQPLEIHTTLELSQTERQELAEIKGLRSKPGNVNRNIILTIAQRGDLSRFQSLLARAYAQSVGKR